MASKSSDQLSAALEHVRAWATAQRVAVVPGSLIDDREGVPGVQFMHDRAESEPQPLASAKAFTKTLSELDVAMLVMSVVTLDEESWQAAVGLYEEDPDIFTGPDADEGRAVLASLLADARAAQKHVGKPGSVAITAITRNPAVTIEWFEMAEWYAVIEAADHAFTEMAEGGSGEVDEEAYDDDDDGWIEVQNEPRR